MRLPDIRDGTVQKRHHCAFSGSLAGRLVGDVRPDVQRDLGRRIECPLRNLV